jgi:hypothetical protein
VRTVRRRFREFSINSSTGVLTTIGTSAGNGGSAENSLVIVTP